MTTEAEFPPPSMGAGFNAAWIYLEREIARIMTGHTDIPNSKCEGLQMFVASYCTSSPRVGMGGQTSPYSMERELYNKLSDYFVAHLNEIHLVSEATFHQELLRYYNREWDKYIAGASHVDRIFSHLNQGWIRHERTEGRTDIYTIYALALSQWKISFFFPIQKRTRLTLPLLKIIESQRNGEIIDEGLVQKIIDSFVHLEDSKGLDTAKVSLDVYVEHFEGPFIEATKKYYIDESVTFLEENSISSYLKHVEARLKEEGHRSDAYLHANTRRILIEKCDEVLIRRHSEKFLDHFQHTLDLDSDEDRERVFSLLARIPDGPTTLQRKFQDFVKLAGQQAISNLVGECSANLESLEPSLYVDTLLNVHHKYQDMVQRSFKHDKGFLEVLDNACRTFVNLNDATVPSTTKSQHLLAKHMDSVLLKASKGSEDKMDDDLGQSVILIKYIDDKDAFMTYYTDNLAMRLVHGISVSDDAEASMIFRLKDVFPSEKTRQLEGMLNDKREGKILTERFRKNVEQSGHLADGNIIFNSIMVLASNFWPLKPPAPGFIVPNEILPTHAFLTRWYLNTTSGRRLTWLWDLSRNELRTNYLSQNYTLTTTSHQMAVLLQYNRNDKLALDELTVCTGIGKGPLMQILTNLVKAKVLNGEVGHYNLNLEFSSDNVCVNLDPSLVAHPTMGEVAFGDRIDIEALIVRTMKARAMMKDQALIQEVVSQISTRFTPKVFEIKRSIENLLEKEYIERVEGQRDTFRYLP